MILVPGFVISLTQPCEFERIFKLRMDWRWRQIEAESNYVLVRTKRNNKKCQMQIGNRGLSRERTKIVIPRQTTEFLWCGHFRTVCIEKGSRLHWRLDSLCQCALWIFRLEGKSWRFAAQSPLGLSVSIIVPCLVRFAPEGNVPLVACHLFL